MQICDLLNGRWHATVFEEQQGLVRLSRVDDLVEDGEGLALRHGTLYAGGLACGKSVSGRPEGLIRSNNIQDFYLVEDHCVATGQCPVPSGR